MQTRRQRLTSIPYRFPSRGRVGRRWRSGQRATGATELRGQGSVVVKRWPGCKKKGERVRTAGPPRGVCQRSYIDGLFEGSGTKAQRRTESVLKVLESRFRGMRRPFHVQRFASSRVLPLFSAAVPALPSQPTCANSRVVVSCTCHTRPSSIFPSLAFDAL